MLEGIDPSFVAYGTDGKAYAVAYKTSIFMLFYNKDLLSKAGLDPEKAPATWSEWQQMSDQITAAGAGEYWGGGIPPSPTTAVSCAPPLLPSAGHRFPAATIGST